MARVTYEYPIKDICGKIGKDSTMGFAHRGETKYTVKYGKRTTAVTADEQAQREKFAAVVKATQARMQDPVQAAQDQLAFAAQSKYKSLYKYVFNQEWAKA
ncbi:MAG: hypothetical protein ACI4TV_03670 [Paludibacteraceae bacterium]